MTTETINRIAVVVTAVIFAFLLSCDIRNGSLHATYTIVPIAASIWLIARAVDTEVPLIELFTAAAMICAIHAITHLIVGSLGLAGTALMALWMGHVLVEVACVYGFGWRWVRRGYVHRRRNVW
jgi:hypothetical protein